MMLVYYDPQDGQLLYTVNGNRDRPPPSGSYIEVPHQTLQLALWRVVDGVLTPMLDEIIAEARAGGIAKVNERSGELRSAFITVIPGQEMLYLLKEREAIRWIEEAAAHEKAPETHPPPDPAQFELIAAEVGITAPDAAAVAQVYVNMAYMLRLTAAQLETLRLGAVSVIEGATSEQEITDAVAAFMERAA